MNEVVLIGNLTKDPEMRSTNNGMSVCRFSLAINDRKQDPKTGEWVDDTIYIPVIVWGKQADNCGRYLNKGKKCAVKGKIKTGSYEKDGRKVYTTDVVAFNVEFLSPKEERPQEDHVPVGFEEVANEIPF